MTGVRREWCVECLGEVEVGVLRLAWTFCCCCVHTGIAYRTNCPACCNTNMQDMQAPLPRSPSLSSSGRCVPKRGCQNSRPSSCSFSALYLRGVRVYLFVQQVGVCKAGGSAQAVSAGQRSSMSAGQQPTSLLHACAAVCWPFSQHNRLNSDTPALFWTIASPQPHYLLSSHSRSLMSDHCAPAGSHRCQLCTILKRLASCSS